MNLHKDLVLEIFQLVIKTMKEFNLNDQEQKEIHNKFHISMYLNELVYLKMM